MASINKVIIIGNLGKDPESRILPTGEAVSVFSIATTEQWKDKSGSKQERTDWHRVEFIGRTAEVANEYLKKGSQAYVEGSLRYDKWTDKDGVEKTLTKIRGDKLTLLGGKRDESGGNGAPASRPPASSAAKPATSKPSPKLDDFDDDIPF